MVDLEDRFYWNGRLVRATMWKALAVNSEWAEAFGVDSVVSWVLKLNSMDKAEERRITVSISNKLTRQVAVTELAECISEYATIRRVTW